MLLTWELACPRPKIGCGGGKHVYTVFAFWLVSHVRWGAKPLSLVSLVPESASDVLFGFLPP